MPLAGLLLACPLAVASMTGTPAGIAAPATLAVGAAPVRPLAVGAAPVRPRALLVAMPPAAPAAQARLAVAPALPAAAQARPAAMPARYEVWRSADGLFYVDAKVNGQAVRFLVDTGASMIVLTAADARRVAAAPHGGPGYVADTASGAAAMTAVTLGEVEVAGRRASAVRAAVAPAGLTVSLLGQTWLAVMDAVTIEGDRMTLR